MPEAHRFRWSGAFADDALEAEYRTDALAERRRYTVFSLSIASAVFLAYGVHDALVVPSVRGDAWLVRYGVFLPVALAVLALVRSRHFERFGQAAMLAYGLSATFVVLQVGVHAPTHGFFLYTSYAVLFVTLGPFIARMNVATQATYTALSVVLYNLLDASAAHSPLPIRASMSATLFSMGAIGTVLAHELERLARESFAQRRLIQRQVVELDAEKKRSEELLLNVLPKNIAERLKNDDEPIADGFSRVSVLFADIVGFTQMTTKITPEELVRRLNRVFSSFDDLSDELKLEKIKTIGDCYMVAAGLHSHEYDHAQTIAEMALAMQRRVRGFSEELGEPLSLRIGIHTGPVVAGVIGKRKFIYDVWGDTVNTASRMESHSEPGRIQVSEDTHALLEGRYDFEPRGDVEIKGKGKMKTWFLVGPLGSRKDPGMRETQLPRRVDA